VGSANDGHDDDDSLEVGSADKKGRYTHCGPFIGQKLSARHYNAMHMTASLCYNT
jgi:hypothetical protein